MAGVMLETRSKRRSSQDSRPRASRRKTPPETMPKREGGIDLEVLDVQESLGTAKPCREPGAGRRDQGRRDRDQQLGPEDDRLPEGDGETGEREAREVDEAGQRRAAGPGRKAGSDRRARRRSPPAASGSRHSLGDPPVGVIGRRRHDPDVMAARGEPGSHLAGELADARRLGRMVEAIDQEAQAATPLPATIEA